MQLYVLLFCGLVIAAVIITAAILSYRSGKTLAEKKAVENENERKSDVIKRMGEIADAGAKPQNTSDDLHGGKF